ncbi:DNA endonuclease SmrA [Teredinibacter waterburyi]|jgi:Uncharacterized protein conserved in bacteria|uniref:DNA endonuclease SmrA n=1 Tax=Teredinibacter waterburyi TaxID=1500538 RepID=UPI00165FCF9B|nr:DNA endonuclease SmrA [Teredinibacter waterburyi]
MSDDGDFSSLLGDDVQPLKVEKRVDIKAPRDADVDKEARRLSAEAATSTKADPLSTPVDMVDPLAVLSFQRAGVQHGVFKSLRLGKYPPEARLDLHRMTVEQARRTIFQFVKDCIANDVRSALITHGKGEGRETPALLKSCVNHWLPQFEEVLAFHSAQKQHGSYGATYVLLRKSDRKRLEAKETYSRKQRGL